MYIKIHLIRRGRVSSNCDMVLYENCGEIYVVYSMKQERAKGLGVGCYA